MASLVVRMRNVEGDTKNLNPCATVALRRILSRIKKNEQSKRTQPTKPDPPIIFFIYIYASPPPKPMFLSAGVQLVSIFVHLTMYYKNVQIHKVMCLLNSSWME